MLQRAGRADWLQEIQMSTKWLIHKSDTTRRDQLCLSLPFVEWVGFAFGLLLLPAQVAKLICDRVQLGTMVARTLAEAPYFSLRPVHHHCFTGPLSPLINWKTIAMFCSHLPLHSHLLISARQFSSTPRTFVSLSINQLISNYIYLLTD